MTVCSIITFCL